MPAAVVKGILLTIGIVTALGYAVLENPHIQAWLEEQRQKLIVLLRSIGDDLDPPSRRAAEAFAFEGRTPDNDENIRREANASIEAAAIATGRSLSSPSTIRRIPISGPTDPSAAEERARKGKEYLAQRLQKLQEMRQRDTGSAHEIGSSISSLRNKSSENTLDAPGSSNFSIRSMDELQSMFDTVPSADADDTFVAPHPQTSQTVPIADSMSSAWQSGSRIANPFGDEYALDRSTTPKPLVPPKVALDSPLRQSSVGHRGQSNSPICDLELQTPGNFRDALRDERSATPAIEALEELSYEEQLAIALSLSEQDGMSSSAPSAADSPEEEANLRAAIANSLRESEPRHSSNATTGSTIGPLIDLTAPAQHDESSSAEWASMYHSIPQARTIVSPNPPSIMSDELYRTTPRLTAAKLAHHDAELASASDRHAETNSPSVLDLEHPPVQVEHPTFYSCPSEMSRSSSPDTIGREQVAKDPRSHPEDQPLAITNLLQDNTVETDTHSSAHSEAFVEVVDAEDSDVDPEVISDDGIATPDSWSEVDEEEVEMGAT